MKRKYTGTMLNDWTYWLSSIPRDELAWLFAPIILIDGMRYTLTGLCVWLYDCIDGLLKRLTGRELRVTFDYCPSVSVVVAGLNAIPFNERGISFQRFQLVNILCKQWRNSATG